MAQFSLSQIQAQAILDMQLQRLTGLERQKILDELAELLALIERLLAILSSEKLVMQIIVDELRAVREKHGDERRTEILAEEGEFRAEDLIAEDDMAITVSNTGYIKRTAITNYRNQRRGGKGRIGMRTREEDFVSHLFVASTHAYIMIFSDRGRVYWLKVYTIPDVGPDGRGKAIANLVSMEEGERIAALLTVKEFEAGKFIVMGPGHGVIKKTELTAFSNPRAGGIIAMGVEEGDSMIDAQVSDGAGEIFIGTRNGMSIRFAEADVRSMGRAAYGVRGSRFATTIPSWRWNVLRAGGTILSVTERRLRQRTELVEYRLQSRGGIGIINIQTSDRNGKVVGISEVTDDEELMLMTQQGKILRMASKDIRTIGRATQGVRLIDIEGDDRGGVYRASGRGRRRRAAALTKRRRSRWPRGGGDVPYATSSFANFARSVFCPHRGESHHQLRVVVGGSTLRTVPRAKRRVANARPWPEADRRGLVLVLIGEGGWFLARFAVSPCSAIWIRARPWNDDS